LSSRRSLQLGVEEYDRQAVERVIARLRDRDVDDRE
jgi:hypothetical protein